jgi:hypothetical protein
LKINITTSSYFPSIDGTSFVVQQNVKALLQLGYTVNVFTNTNSKSKFGENVFTFKIKGNGTLLKRFKGEIEKYKEVLKKESENSFLNIYHGWHAWPTHLALDENITSTKQIVYSHGTGFNTKEPLLKRYARRFLYFYQKSIILKYLGQIDAMIFISNDRKHPRCFDYHTFKKKSFYIDNPSFERINDIENCDIEKLRKIENLVKTPKKTFLNISNYQSIKNQKFLVKLIHKSGYDINLIFVGSDNNKYLQSLIKLNNRFKNPEKIIFLTNIPDYMINYLFTKTDCFLFSSNNDFVPLVLIESNKNSLPFLSFQTADTKRDGGFFAENKKDYIRIFDKIVNSTKLELSEIGKKGYIYYQQNNTFEIYLTKISHVINYFKNE